MDLDLSDLPPLPPRPSDGHKGTFGTVLVVGGCDADGVVMVGGPALTARAALRAGCGLVKLAMPDAIVAHGLVITPSATGLALPRHDKGRLKPSAAAAVLAQEVERAACLAVGPGWGVGFEQQQILMWLIGQAPCPIVLDADGLNNLAAVPDFARDLKAPMILTPHPGEFGRLCEGVGGQGSGEESQAAGRKGTPAPLKGRGDPGPQAASPDELARRLGCIVVLKGAGTVVSDGQRTWTMPLRNPALASGGTGDVLTGIIASFVAQFWKAHLGPMTPSRQGGLDLFDAARWGVAVHALAAKRWSEAHGNAGLLAMEVGELVPDVLREIRQK